MLEFIVLLVCGIFVMILGVLTLKGNVSLIHWYHRKRVTEENMIPFSKAMGLGTIITGLAIIFFGALYFIAQKTSMQVLSTVGAVLLIIGITAGLIIMLYALIKYNKGIF